MRGFIKYMKNKGISLIVLVITIVIMIILATAVILSLNSSNLVDKATLAKYKSDLSSLQEIIVAKVAERQLSNQDTSGRYVLSDWGIENSEYEDKVIIENSKLVLRVTDNESLKAAATELGISTVSSSETTTLANTKGVDLLNYRIYGNSFQSILPYPYQSVDYIENTGTQYIDTGYRYESKNVKLEIEFSIHATDNYGGSILASYSSSPYGLNSFFLANNNLRVYVGGVSGNDFTITNGVKNNYEITVNDLNCKTTLNGQTKSMVMNSMLLTRNMQYSQNVCVFSALTWLGNATEISKNTRVYKFKIYDSENLVRDMIPCYNVQTSEIGMYDKANNIFYKNAGTGTFLKGDNFAPTPSKPIEVLSLGENGSIEVISRGKNLFNKNSQYLNAYFDATTKQITSSTINRVYSISCKPNTSYVVTTFGTAFRSLGTTEIYPEIGTTVNQIFETNNHEIINIPITTNSTAKYIVIRVRSVGTTTYDEILNSIQIEEGATATAYEQYQAPIITTIDLTGHEPLRKIGNIADYIDYKNKKIIRNIKKYELKGTETIYTAKKYFGYDLPGMSQKNVQDSENLILNSHFKYDTYTWGNDSIRYGFVVNLGSLYIRNLDFDNIESFKSWLTQQYTKGTPVTVYYQLATPIEEPFECQEIPTLNGTTVLSVRDANNIQASNIVTEY